MSRIYCLPFAGKVHLTFDEFVDHIMEYLDNYPQEKSSGSNEGNTGSDTRMEHKELRKVS